LDEEVLVTKVECGQNVPIKMDSMINIEFKDITLEELTKFISFLPKGKGSRESMESTLIFSKHD
jgi:hypothetical protein